MKLSLKMLATGLLGLSMAATSLTPAAAVQIPVPVAKPAVDVQTVQYRPDHGRRDWRRPPPPRNGWYKGHRGYRDSRPGYRRHSDGYWYPLAAFAIGSIIGGAVNAPRPAYAMPASHVRWCEARYRTYRAYDNTYVPRAGVRAQCVSPYSR